MLLQDIKKLLLQPIVVTIENKEFNQLIDNK